jgi:hypothetical protein
MSDPVLRKIAALRRLPTEALKAKYRELVGGEPNARNRTHIESRLAYRIQELAYGALSAEASATLDRLADAIEAKARPRQPLDRPIRGTRFVRTWHGVEHVVTTTDSGFEYQGRPYGSLSAVAKAITGVKWSGNLFFGLRSHPRARR